MTPEELKAQEDALLAKIEAKGKAQVDAAKTEFTALIEKHKEGTVTTEVMKAEIDKISKTLTENESEAIKGFQTTLNAQKEQIEKYEGIVKEQGVELAKLKEANIVNPDFSVNKGVLRTLVENHLKDSGVLGTTEKNEHGIETTPVNLKATHNTNNTAVKQSFDLRSLSKRHVAQKAGENIFISGTGTQSVFNQAINRTGIGEIAPPLTSNEHALDIFNTTNVTGSLMTLLVYENLEDNGELVAEGVAPSADSRIELNSKDFKVFDFSATATISKNLLRDSGEVIDELVRQLASGIKTVIDNNLFVSGGDNSTAPWGVFNTTHSCEVFNPLLFTGTSKAANVISVLGKAKLQGRLNDWMTDSIILSPTEWDEIEDLKDQNDNSIRDNRLATDSLGNVVAVKGMRQYQTTKMAENTAIVYNSSLQTIGLRQDVETAFGFNNDDFKKRKVSWVMDLRVGYGQKAKESSIFVDDIAGAIAILKESAAASLTRVQGYATGSDATALTIATLANAGVVGAIESNLADYKVSVAGEASIADLPALQALIDSDNA